MHEVKDVLRWTLLGSALAALLVGGAAGCGTNGKKILAGGGAGGGAAGRGGSAAGASGGSGGQAGGGGGAGAQSGGGSVGGAGAESGAGGGSAGQLGVGGGGGTSGAAGSTSATGGVGGSAACLPFPGQAGPSGAGGESPSRVLYSNDFEHPNVPLVVDCGNSLDSRGIDLLYGTPTFRFTQVNSVEGVVVHDPGHLYKDDSSVPGQYALGMLSQLQDDKLSLTFPVTGKPFLNVGLDLSAIDVQGCGGPFGVAAPIMKVSLYANDEATFDFGKVHGDPLATGMITGVAPPDQWTFAWTYGVVALDASANTAPYLSVVFDLTQSGYAAFDNLSIVSSSTAGVVDANNDGIPDDEEVCLGQGGAGGAANRL